jgi:RsiW-degrading membrane proteinase PrsW (M82 family)
VTNSYAAALFILLGLFLLGGVISFFKQGLPKIAVGVLLVCSAMSIASGVMRWK